MSPGGARRNASRSQEARNGSARDHGREEHPAPAAARERMPQRKPDGRQPRGSEPQPVVAAGKPARSQRAPLGSGGGRPNGQAQANRFDSKARQPWEPRPPRSQRSRDDHAPSPVGLGDHVPAFLKKGPRPAPR
jgi:hypothetical protein